MTKTRIINFDQTLWDDGRHMFSNVASTRNVTVNVRVYAEEHMQALAEEQMQALAQEHMQAPAEEHMHLLKCSCRQCLGARAGTCSRAHVGTRSTTKTLACTRVMIKR